MTIISATTTITVLRQTVQLVDENAVDPLAASYEGLTDGLAVKTSLLRPVVTGLRANIGSPAIGRRTDGGDQEVATFRMQTDPFDILQTDQVKDERTGLVYDVSSAIQRAAFSGREYTQCTIIRTRGAAM
jgi:hypothetical protein